MNNTLIRHILLFLIVIAITSSTSCRNRKKIQEPKPPTTNCKLTPRAPRNLVNDMRKSEFKFDWLSARLYCQAKDDSTNPISFDVALRMRYDSIIWMNVMDPVIGIKAARVLITKDSVFFVNYLDNSCFSGDFTYLSQMLGTEVDFDMMQSLLVGNSVSFYDEDDKLRSSVNFTDCRFVLSTVRKRKLKKVLEGQKPISEPIQTITLAPETFKILSILFLDEQNRTFTAEYSGFDTGDSLALPHQANFYAKGLQKSATLIMSYKKIQINQVQQFPFSLPDDCTPINTNKQGK